MSARVLFVEDDAGIRRPTAQILVDEGYEVDEAESGEAALEHFTDHPADLVLVDLLLPGIDGFEVTRELRRRSDVPIIFVTGRADPFDVVAGLEAGADDYVTKPFEPKELTARMRALLRRARRPAGGTSVIRLGDRLEIVPDEGVVRCDSREVHLTRTEFRLLCEMAATPGRVFSRDLLLDEVWGYEYFGETKLVDVHIHRLRQKIERDPTNPKHVVTVRGLGYKAVR